MKYLNPEEFYKFSLDLKDKGSPLHLYYRNGIWYGYFAEKPLDKWYNQVWRIDDNSEEFKDMIYTEIKRWQFRQELNGVLK
jgi:hypothetical protein